MPSPLRLTGTIASRGFAEGPLLPLGGRRQAARSVGSPSDEADALAAAVASAIQELVELTSRIESTGAEMIEFQIAMLEDAALTETAFERIAGGASAESGWTDTLAEQIASYESAEDEYFRARSADLVDIRERVLRALTGANDAALLAGAILAGDDITPSQFLSADWSKGGGIVLRQGSAASHVAMLARARGVPMLIGLSDLPLENAALALVDADEGSVVLHPSDESRVRFRERKTADAHRSDRAAAKASEPAATADGTAISVNLNVADPEELKAIRPDTCDGIGLVRTEFLYRNGLPNEDTQLQAYRQIVRWAAGKPVVFRTIDAGGDKPIAGLTVEESNPFLGLRGIRLALARPEVFRIQVRALLRVAAEGNVSVMLPMVTIEDEYAAAKALFFDESERLASKAIPHALPRLGIMVEVPAVAIAPELLASAAFFSIGSNDLTQYVMAAGRDSAKVSGLLDACHPSILSLIGNVVRVGASRGIPVSLCGDAGGDPAALPLLLKSGLRSVSVAPAQLPMAKLAISQTDLGGD